MGPPLRSFAADAHDCIVVPVLGPTAYKVVARFNRARKRAPLWLSSRLHHRARSRQDESWRDRTKNPTMEKCVTLLDSKSPIQGPWCRVRREARARERHRHWRGG